MLRPGSIAPDFTLLDQDGKPHTLSGYRGKWVLIYFYPKDDTPGCTKQACSVRDAKTDFQKMKTVVLGISADTVQSHKKFAQKHQLSFPLLADVDKKAIRAYGAWGKKKFMGREYEGILRISYLVDPLGKIARSYERVRPAEQAEEVLGDLESIGA